MQHSRLAVALLFLALPAAIAAEPAKSLSAQLKLFESLKEVIVDISSRVKPWVVHIEAVKKQGSQKYKIVGSGLILKSDGYIITNDHLVDEASLITVTLPNMEKLEARLLGTDRHTDLALIKIDPAQKLPEPLLGDSSSVSVGEWIIAVGNPYGFDRTVYFGIVSGKGRTLATMSSYQEGDSGFEFTTDFIQTDASIDPGSSGGPLVNLKGEVIGINSMGLGRGISFTIPIDTVKEVIGKLMTQGRLSRGWIGLSIQPLTTELADYFKAGLEGGVLVSDIQEDSPAKAAGFRQGDIITDFGGKKVKAKNEEELNQVSQLIWAADVGSRIPVRVRRGKSFVPLKVTVAEQPKIQARELETSWGFNVKEITQEIYRDFLLENRNGVIVTFVEPGTPGGEAQLFEGDIISAVDGARVRDFGEFEKEYLKLKNEAGRVLLLIKRRKDSLFTLLEISKYRRPLKP